MDKHILILTTTNDFLCKFEQENVKILQEMGYTVHYATNFQEPSYISDQQKIEQMGVVTHHIDIARSPFLFQYNQKALRQLLALIENQSIQVIHCHTPVGGLLGRIAGKLCRDKKPIVIYTAHGFHFYKGAPIFNHLVYYPVEKWLARETDILIVINEEDYRAARKFHLKKGGHLYKIPGVGLNRNRFHPFTERERAARRKALGINPNEYFLVSVGELNENKNHRIVLQALATMAQRCNGHFHLRYGICGDGFFRGRIEQWIQTMGLTEIVTLFGHCADITGIVGCADAMVFPSKREGLGMAGLEALSMGVPVIAADNRGTREYMEHGKNGFIYRYDDVEGFIEGIQAIQEQSPEQRERMKGYCLDSVKPFDQVYARAVMRRIYAGVDQRIGRELHEKSSENQHHYGSVSFR